MSWNLANGCALHVWRQGSNRPTFFTAGCNDFFLYAQAARQQDTRKTLTTNRITKYTHGAFPFCQDLVCGMKRRGCNFSDTACRGSRGFSILRRFTTGSQCFVSMSPLRHHRTLGRATRIISNAWGVPLTVEILREQSMVVNTAERLNCKDQLSGKTNLL